MKGLAKISAVIMIVSLFASCKNDRSDYRQNDTEKMTTTDKSDPPTAYKDTIVKPGDSINMPLTEENAKSQGEQIP